MNITGTIKGSIMKQTASSREKKTENVQHEKYLVSIFVE